MLTILIYIQAKHFQCTDFLYLRFQIHLEKEILLPEYLLKRAIKKLLEIASFVEVLFSAKGNVKCFRLFFVFFRFKTLCFKN